MSATEVGSRSQPSKEVDEIDRLIECEQKARAEKEEEQRAWARRDDNAAEFAWQTANRYRILCRWVAALVTGVTLLLSVAVLILLSLRSNTAEIANAIAIKLEEVVKLYAVPRQQPQGVLRIAQWRSEAFSPEHPECQNGCRNWSRISAQQERLNSSSHAPEAKELVSSDDTPMQALRSLDHSLSLVLIVGGHDRIAVGQVDGRAFNTNDELAQLRADNVQRELQKSIDPTSQVRFITLPRKNSHAEEHFDEDRTVTVTIMSEPQQ